LLIPGAELTVENSINIRPGVGILGLFPAMNYRAWYALAELVDNAIDSYLTNRKALRKLEGAGYRLRIVITVENDADGSITVWDNAAGIAAKDYARAFVTADPPKDSAGLSQFGIGLKSASCWFARQWRVTTTALGEPTMRIVDFDVPRIIRDQQDRLDIRTRKATEADHWTEVRLWDLYKPPQTQTIGKMRSHLASMYRKFLRDGDVVIEFNGKEIEYEEPPILVAPYFLDEAAGDKNWRKDIDFTLKTQERVHGFVGLREKGSTKFAGLALFRHGRLIVGSDDETYRPPEIFGGSNSYAYQRVFGELHLDDFDVSHTKDAFIWGNRETAFLHQLRKSIDSPPLSMLKQADGYRARRASKDLMKAAETAVASTAHALEQSVQVIEDQLDLPPEEVKLPQSFPTAHAAGQRILNLDVRGKPWVVSIDLTTDPAATQWVQLMERSQSRGRRHLGIRLSMSHPFTQRFGGANAEQIEALVRLAAGVAIAEITARESGVKEAGTIRRNLNELLLDALSRA
jgi:hypothetical protein